MGRRKMIKEYEQHFAELQQRALTPFERQDISGIEPGCGPGGSEHPKPGVYLPNPDVSAPIDRGRVQPPAQRQRGFGYQLRPNNINDLPVGDAGPGVSYFRRAQFYLSTGLDTTEGQRASDLQYDIPVPIATARSMDTRPRFWHVSFFGISVDSFENNPAPPLSEYDIATRGNRFPTATVLKGRIQVHDESGSRFFDMNIHGTASMSMYAFGVTTYILLPSAVIDGNRVALGYEVNVQNQSSLIDLRGVVENTLATGRVVGLTQNDTKYTDHITRATTVPSGGTSRIRIPPGARCVTLQTTTRHPAAFTTGATYGIYFATEQGDRGTLNQIGRIELQPGQLNTGRILVPNATWILFDDDEDAGAVDWVAVFEVEA